jgi:hypothetical protein
VRKASHRLGVDGLAARLWSIDIPQKLGSPVHGYGIVRRIEQLSQEALRVSQGTIYLCLIRLAQKRWTSAAWGACRRCDEL